MVKFVRLDLTNELASANLTVNERNLVRVARGNIGIDLRTLYRSEELLGHQVLKGRYSPMQAHTPIHFPGSILISLVDHVDDPSLNERLANVWKSPRRTIEVSGV